MSKEILPIYIENKHRLTREILPVYIEDKHRKEKGDKKMSSNSKMIIIETKENYEVYDKDENFTMSELYKLSNQFYMKIFKSRY